MSAPAMYDAKRGGAIWNRQMSRTDGEYVAAWMVAALREVALGGDIQWQDRTLETAYPEDMNELEMAVGSNVLILMRDDFKAQLAEARARGDYIPPVNETVGPV